MRAKGGNSFSSFVPSRTVRCVKGGGIAREADTVSARFEVLFIVSFEPSADCNLTVVLCPCGQYYLESTQTEGQ